MNELENRLFSLPDWGYVIYRTTYTTESETAFPHAIRHIEACLENGFFHSAQPTRRYTDTKLREMWSKHRSTIIEDPVQLNGASLEKVRLHFQNWVDIQLKGERDSFNKFRMCLIIDEECLQTLKDAPVEVEHIRFSDDEQLRMVKALEAFPIMDPFSTFPGWMKCWTHALWFFWECMADSEEMRKSYDSIEDSDSLFEGVFCG